MASWPAVIPEISVVPPSLRMFPVMVDSNKLMVSLVQDGDAGARQRHNLVAHQVDVHALDAVRQHVLEGEPGEVARPRADSAQRVLGDALRGEGGDELVVRVELVHDAHVLDLGIVGPPHDLQKVVELRRAGDRVPRVLQGPQLHLALEVERVRAGPWILQVSALAEGVRGLPESHKGPHQLGVGPGRRHVVAGDARGHVGDLGVHGGVPESSTLLKDSTRALSSVTWEAKTRTLSMLKSLVPPAGRSASPASANSISRTRFSCGGNILPLWKSPMRVGAISTSRYSPAGMACALPPGSCQKPSRPRWLYHSCGFSKEYRKQLRPYSLMSSVRWPLE